MSKVRSVFAALCFSLLVGSVAAFVDYGGSGGGGSGSGSTTLDGLTDVDVSTAVTNNVLIKRGDGTWVGGSASGSGDGTGNWSAVGSSSSSLAGNAVVSGTEFTVGSSTFVVKEGKVGIGTTAPLSLFDVKNFFYSDGPNTYAEAFNATSAAVRDQFSVGTSSFHVTSLGIAQGIVGVGTTNPAYSIDVSYSKAGTVGLSVQNTNSFGDSGLRYYDNNGNVVFDTVYGNENSSTHPGELYLTFQTGRLGVGTTSPSYRFHSVSDAGTSGTLFAVSTGSVDLFRVLGTSVNFKVPLVFPDGTVQASAAAAGTGDIESVTAGTNLTGGGTSGAVTLNVADNIALTSGTFAGDVTVYGSIKGSGSSGGTLTFTTTTGTIQNATNISAIGLMNSSVTLNNGMLVLSNATSNYMTLSADGKSTGTFTAKNIDPVLWTDITISSDSLAAGGTFWMLTAPSNSAITITSVVALTYSVAASTANFGLQEKVTQNANGSWLHTGTYSSGTWNHMNPVTSFADSSIAAGSSVFLVTKDGGSVAGTPRALTVILYYKYDNP